MITIGLTEILLIGLFSLAILVSVYSLVKSAKKVKDYERIKDYIMIGTLMWLLGTYGFDSSLRNAGMCIFGYGLVLLLYNYYKKGYEEGLSEREDKHD